MVDVLELSKKIREAKNDKVAETLMIQLGTLLDIRLRNVNKIIPFAVILSTVEKSLEDYIVRYADVDVTAMRNAKTMYELITAYLQVVNNVVEKLVDPYYESRYGFAVTKDKVNFKIELVTNAVDIITAVLGFSEKVHVMVGAEGGRGEKERQSTSSSE